MGMHVCANVVCSPTARVDAELARGPARLTKALGIELGDDAVALDARPFALELPPSPSPVATGPRVGVSGAGGTDAFPLRFWIPQDPTVSVYRRSPRG